MPPEDPPQIDTEQILDVVTAQVEMLSGMRAGLIRNGFTPETAEHLVLVFFHNVMAGARTNN